ncbi:MAG: homocysteine S-methyltransferase family protein [Clostridia bacterium]|nr:homocysteine S-methyltransferase family protein [Clostridia bacterium]
MARKKITEVVGSGKILVSDGAWGTFLYKKGLKAGECPELWCIDRFDDVKDIAKCYIDAGSDMTESNSFGGSSLMLGKLGLANRAAEINEAAARASREAAGDDKWVIASIGPTGKMLVMEEVTEEEMYDSFKEQAIALEKGGADALCIETMSDIGEATLAIKAAKENTKCEVICTFTYSKTVRGDYKTMMGVSPVDAAKASLEAGADIIGANCGNGMERMIEIVKEIRTVAPKTPILIHANAGLPTNINGVDVFPETPEMMASFVDQLIDSGANIIGGCCGTTPDHIRAIKKAVLNHK